VYLRIPNIIHPFDSIPIDVPRAPQSALLNAAKSGKTSIYRLFGGQGTDEVYFAELKALYETYKPYVVELVACITNEVLIPAATEATNVDGYTHYSHRLDVLSWLEGPKEVQPPIEYLASIPISFPLIGLAQLVQYIVVVKVNNPTPQSLRALVHGATGRSHGIVSAVVPSTSTTEESFISNSIKASKWLFYSGLWGQEAFPVLALEPRVTQDPIEGGEHYPTPMLAVSGLARSMLDTHISKTNEHLAENAKLYIGLHNGAKKAVVVGPARSLYGLVMVLRKIRAPAGADQSKIPYSQRKIMFSIRFLVVNVPYHTDYLQGATDKVDLEGKELWIPEELAVPVFHTEDGA
jgi:fatty acid synthase subunit alpha